MNAVASISGGKDSIYALYVALKEELKIDYLLFINNGSKAHRMNRWLLKLVSDALEIPLVTANKEINDVKRVLSNLKANVLVSGVMTTPEHMDWYREICEPIGVKHYAPLWGMDPLSALTHIKELGFQILIIEVNTSLGCHRSWLGKKLDGAVFEELKELENKQKINPIGEFGEYHTFVLDCPIYRKKIKILDSENIWENAKGYTLIKDACLQPKTS